MIDTHTETAVVVVAIRYATSSDGVERVEAIGGIVSREGEARILSGSGGVVIRSQRVDSGVAVTVDCIGSSEVANTVVTVIAVVRMDWVFEVSSDVQVEKVLRGE
ncbi:hypothetical protein HO173_005000 [Letharia columbiana]|uniref:Uncharacterized protein n=1 Tax=Letharia columbiana TaxID=112416 RepID=A0A8H6L5X9_9LECA|nr:uncharacterized protein HO173_005000 [Letharia columbiana]KAF6236709.1 hypothetical protein HO173_005000 [Letharia columbiana]